MRPASRWSSSILADAASLTLQFLHCGPETTGSERNDEMSGAPKGDPVPLDWTGKRSAPVTITVQTGGWPTGMYTARLTTDDGRVGFAPFVLRPPTLGAARQLVVLPTNTWQAYNMYDRDGDGWGDTWYAGGEPPVELEPPLPRSRRAAALQGVRPGIPALAGPHGQAPGHGGRGRPRGVRLG